MFFFANILGLSVLKTVPMEAVWRCRKEPSFSALQALANTTNLWLAAMFRYALTRTSIGRAAVWLPTSFKEAVFAGASFDAPRLGILSTINPDANVSMGCESWAAQSKASWQSSGRFVAASHNFKMKWTRYTPASSPKCARTSLAHFGLGEQRLRATYLQRYSSVFGLEAL